VAGESRIPLQRDSTPKEEFGASWIPARLARALQSQAGGPARPNDEEFYTVVRAGSIRIRIRRIGGEKMCGMFMFFEAILTGNATSAFPTTYNGD